MSRLDSDLLQVKSFTNSLKSDLKLNRRHQSLVLAQSTQMLKTLERKLNLKDNEARLLSLKMVDAREVLANDTKLARIRDAAKEIKGRLI
jgi:hypothetical protein